MNLLFNFGVEPVREDCDTRPDDTQLVRPVGILHPHAEILASTERAVVFIGHDADCRVCHNNCKRLASNDSLRTL